jgi:hypothetical protein
VTERSANIEENNDTRVVIEQDKYVYDKYGYILILLAIVAVLATGLFGLLFLLRSTAFPPPTYFQATELNQLIQEPPLDKPNIQETVLLNWLAEAMMTDHTFNFINYPSVISAANTDFTPEGFASYKAVLTDKKYIDLVVSKKYVLKASATDAPQILLEKPFAGRYMWKIKIPMRFRYQNVTTDESKPVAITVIVMRVPTSQSPLGVSILKYDIEELPRT